MSLGVVAVPGATTCRGFVDLHGSAARPRGHFGFQPTDPVFADNASGGKITVAIRSQTVT